MKKTNYDEQYVRSVLENVIMEVSKGRIDGKLDFKASLMDEYFFNSIDIMDVLLGVQEVFSDGEYILDVSEILSEFYQGYNAAEMTADILLDYLMKILNRNID